MSRSQPSRAAKDKAADHVKATEQERLDRYGLDLITWLDDVDRVDLPHEQTLRVLADGNFSASTMPSSAALQLHAVHRRAADADGASASLVRLGVVPQRFMDLAGRLIAVAPGAACLKHVFAEMQRLERGSSMIVPEGSLQNPSPFAAASHVWTTYRALRPYGGRTAEDMVTDAPQPERLVQRAAETPIHLAWTRTTEGNISTPVGQDDVFVQTPDTETTSFNRTFERLAVKVDEADETPSGQPRPRLTSNAAISSPTPRPRKGLEHLTTPSATPPAAAPGQHVYLVESPQHQSDTSQQQREHESAQSSRLHPSTPHHLVSSGNARDQVFDKWPYEVQASHFVGAYIHTLMTQCLTLGAYAVAEFLVQEQGYRYGRSDQGGYVFEARPDAVLFCLDQEKNKVPYIYFEFKRDGRIGERTEKVRREELGQFVAMESDLWKERTARVDKATDDTESKQYTRLMVAFDYNALYIVVIQFSDGYLDYILNLESVTFDPEHTKIEDFAVFKEHGPYMITDKKEMITFSKDFLAIAFSGIDNSTDGKLLIKKLDKELEELLRDLSPSEIDQLQRLQSVHGNVLLDGVREKAGAGRAELRHILARSKIRPQGY
ncbi:hypothetical protein P171DRAFT_491963 [Karstenula rhodostoma CBS 690.94]|uniref:Uncharacterized protein n=1 Tax=Karstenula rhodostoma CBS 690.94 TaxID=1392251 RepID=A0A9P4P706_9PLEO|nr:hypothetical protein P171DRAFT_491963 [Karstenula rhodostoma CBS 690.94]